ncbi:hypothetical protein [Parvibaculum sp.]|uniref:hypothetical protein n=1 Tax=Parvibaculum sp. TaxID=2024848 RepID=UPI00391CB0AB
MGILAVLLVLSVIFVGLVFLVIKRPEASAPASSARTALPPVDAVPLKMAMMDLDRGRAATERQIASLSRLGFRDAGLLSGAQAGALLSARDYARGCAMFLFGADWKKPALEALLRETAVFIASDRKLRDAARDWNDVLFKGGRETPAVPPESPARREVMRQMAKLLAEAQASGSLSIET